MKPKPGWARAELPTRVGKLLYLYGALLTGSQAALYALGSRPNPGKDWDLLVPFPAWRRAAMRVPKSARPNGNRGWSFTDYYGTPNALELAVKVDLWPDDVARFLEEATSTTRIRASANPVYVVDLRTALVIRGTRLERVPDPLAHAPNTKRALESMLAEKSSAAAKGATIHNARQQPERVELSTIERRLMIYLEHPQSSVRALSMYVISSLDTRVTHAEVRSAIEHLVELGLVERLGTGRRAAWLRTAMGDRRALQMLESYPSAHRRETP